MTAIENLKHIALGTWPIIIIFLIALVLEVMKFFRFIFPSKAEKYALKIASDKANDVFDIPINYSFRDDEINMMEQVVSRLIKKGKRIITKSYH